MPTTNRDDVIEYLVWLADQPDGVKHRAWLFHAALLIRRDRDTTFVKPTDEALTPVNDRFTLDGV
jgi:hypothetical protein